MSRFFCRENSNVCVVRKLFNDENAQRLRHSTEDLGNWKKQKTKQKEGWERKKKARNFGGPRLGRVLAREGPGQGAGSRKGLS